MVTTRATSRRRLLAAVTLAALAPAGCASQAAARSSTMTGSPTTTGTSLLARVSAPTASPGRAVTFPESDRAYAQEALNDWRAGDIASLKLLTTDPAYQAISTVSSSLRGEAWTFDHSEGAAGSSYLVWTDPAGDTLAFRFVNSGIEPSGGPQHRIIEVLFQPHP